MLRYRIRTPKQRLQPGDRLARHAGLGSDFLDLRAYAPGDDLRFLDWRAYARFGRLFTRVFHAERKSRFFLWLDGSKSMALHGKAAYAERVAGLMLRAARPESAYMLGPDDSRPFSGRFLPDARGPLAALSMLASRIPVSSSLIIITDGLEEGDWHGLFRRLARFSPIFIQILAPQELTPKPAEVQWRDVETEQTVFVTPRVFPAYQKTLSTHLEQLRRLAIRKGNYAHLRVGQPALPALIAQRVLEDR